MSAVFKTTILSIISFFIYKYVILPVSLPEKEEFKKESGKINFTSTNFISGQFQTDTGKRRTYSHFST